MLLRILFESLFVRICVFFIRLAHRVNVILFHATTNNKPILYSLFLNIHFYNVVQWFLLEHMLMLFKQSFFLSVCVCFWFVILWRVQVFMHTRNDNGCVFQIWLYGSVTNCIAQKYICWFKKTNSIKKVHLCCVNELL